jgi:hypothetical protein
MTRAKEVKGKGQDEILVRTSCLLNTYRLIEKKEEKTSEKKTSQPSQSAEEGLAKPQKK